MSADANTKENMKTRTNDSNRERRTSIRLVSALLALTVLLVGAGVVSVVLTGQPDSAPPDTPALPRSGTVEPDFPISGYFISASSRDETNFGKLQDIKAFGGDTVITFGSTLQPATADDLPADCVVDGKSCARVAAGPRTVERYFTFLDASKWGPEALQCPGDRQVTNNGQSYTVLVLPNAGKSCTSTDDKYNIVVAGGSPASSTDPSKSLATAATKLGLKYFAGLPAPAKRSDLPYLPDFSYKAILDLFTDRFLKYQADANDLPGLAGFYHHTEMPLTDSATFDSVFALYASQNDAIHRILPTRQAIISPYIDARVDKSGISVDDARRGIRRMAQTAAGVQLNIAIQDGMGTGKGGAFSPSEAASAVDPYAATIVGQGTWNSKYLAPNKDYFTAAAAGIKGTGAVLWANLEGMAPATKQNPCGDSLRGQTTKARIDRQLQQVAAARKVISFMWDSYYTCKGTGTTLKKQVEAGLTTPIITDVTLQPDTGTLEIIGFNLEGGTATLNWTNKDGEETEKSGKAASFDPSYGVKHGMNPQLGMISVNIGATSIVKGKAFSVNVTNSWGAKATEFDSLLS